MQESSQQPRPPYYQPPKGSTPVIGIIALILAVVSNQPWLGFIALLSLLLSIIALFKKQWITGILSLAISIFSIITSPVLWAGLLAWFAIEVSEENRQRRNTLIQPPAQQRELPAPNTPDELPAPTTPDTLPAPPSNEKEPFKVPGEIEL